MTRIVAVVAISLILAASPALAGGPPNAADLESKFVCPTCHATLDQSDSPVARRMKAYIRDRIDAGASADQITAELVDQFGPTILSSPPKHGFDLLAWALPLGGVAAGALVLGALAVSWSRRRTAETSHPAALDGELERQVDEALARFDG